MNIPNSEYMRADEYLAAARKELQKATDSEVRSAKWLVTHWFNNLEDRLHEQA